MTYQRLPGRGVGWAGYCRLYLGPDHLLMASGTGYAETYKRFFFRDIQAFTLQRTRLATGWTWFWAAMLLACLAVWLLALLAGAPARMQGVIAGAVISSLFALPLLVNLALGPTCACHVRTAVQTEKLPCLRRVRTAEKVLRMLGPLIQAAQGPLPAQVLETVAAAPPPVRAGPGLATPP
jgi:hypothetical protein